MQNQLNNQIMGKINELSFIAKTEKDREFLINSIKDMSYINNFESTNKKQPNINKDVLETLLKYNNMAIIIDFTLHGKRQISTGIFAINKPYSNVPYVSLINKNQKIAIPFLNINGDGIHCIKNSDGTTLYTDKNLLSQNLPKLEQVCKMYGTITATEILLKNISRYINYVQKPILENTSKPANITKPTSSKYKLDSDIEKNKAIEVKPTTTRIIPLKKDKNIQVPNMHI